MSSSSRAPASPFSLPSLTLRPEAAPMVLTTPCNTQRVERQRYYAAPYLLSEQWSTLPHCHTQQTTTHFRGYLRTPVEPGGHEGGRMPNPIVVTSIRFAQAKEAHEQQLAAQNTSESRE